MREKSQDFLALLIRMNPETMVGSHSMGPYNIVLYVCQPHFFDWVVDIQAVLQASSLLFYFNTKIPKVGSNFKNEFLRVSR